MWHSAIKQSKNQGNIVGCNSKFQMIMKSSDSADSFVALWWTKTFFVFWRLALSLLLIVLAVWFLFGVPQYNMTLILSVIREIFLLLTAVISCRNTIILLKSLQKCRNKRHCVLVYLTLWPRNHDMWLHLSHAIWLLWWVSSDSIVALTLQSQKRMGSICIPCFVIDKYLNEELRVIGEWTPAQISGAALKGQAACWSRVLVQYWASASVAVLIF